MSAGDGDGYVVAGINPVEALLGERPERIRFLWVAEAARNPRVAALVERAREAGVPVSETDRTDLARRSEGARHQDVVAEVEGGAVRPESELDELLDAAGDTPLVLVLENLQDPHNLGACLRTAEAAGVDVVLVTRDRSAGLTPVARRASAGASERLPVVGVTNLARALRGLKDRGIWLTGLAMDAEKPLWDADLSGPVALVMGSEGEGLRRLTREHCDYLVRIPMPGATESLNVSVATGVTLFEVARRRSASS